MNKISRWKRTALLLGTSGLLVFGGIVQMNVSTAWALPSSGTSVSGNIVVRDNVNGNPIGSLNEGQEVTIKGQKSGTDGYDWYEVTFDWNGVQTDGWVRSDLIRTGTDSNQTAETGESSPGDSSSENPTAEGTFQSEGKAYNIAESIPQGEIPEGFDETTITYAGVEVPAAKFENAELFLLYLENAEDSDDSGFFVFDIERDSVSPFILKENGNGYVILIDIPVSEASAISGRYVRNDCTFENGIVMAYQLQQADSDITPGVSVSDFYCVYGVSDSGETGWYLYDAENDTLQRSIVNMQYEPTVSETEEESEEPSPVSFDADSVTRMIIAGLGLFCLLLLVLTIIFSVRYRRLRRFLEDECEDEQEFEDDWDEIEEKPDTKTKKQKKIDEEIQNSQKKSPDKKSPDKMLEIELPSGVVDLLDLDDEYEGGYDVKVDKNADYDLPVDDLEQLIEKENLKEQSEPESYDKGNLKEQSEPESYDKGNLKEQTEPEFYDDEDEPEFYDDDEEIPKAENDSKEKTSEWDDEIEFL